MKVVTTLPACTFGTSRRVDAQRWQSVWPTAPSAGPAWGYKGDRGRQMGRDEVAWSLETVRLVTG